jgi:ABC-type bacteriocin/lantibiotic exporter with double-glycine peptidase domain
MLQVCTLLVGGFQCMNGQITPQQLTAFVMVCSYAASSANKWHVQ